MLLKKEQKKKITRETNEAPLNGRREDLGFGISQYCWIVSFGLGLQYRYVSLLKVKNKKAI
jgi:hypothetical protein